MVNEMMDRQSNRKERVLLGRYICGLDSDYFSSIGSFFFGGFFFP